MKKLICAEDIEALIKQGEKTLCIETGTILTPSAKDAARAAKLEICVGKTECTDTPCGADSCEDHVSSELIYSALQVVQSKGLLTEFCTELNKQLSCSESETPVND